MELGYLLPICGMDSKSGTKLLDLRKYYHAPELDHHPWHIFSLLLIYNFIICTFTHTNLAVDH